MGGSDSATFDFGCLRQGQLRKPVHGLFTALDPVNYPLTRPKFSFRNDLKKQQNDRYLRVAKITSEFCFAYFSVFRGSDKNRAI